MSRTIDSSLNVELTGSSTAPVLLVKLAFPSADVNLWSGYGTILFGGDTYTGTGNLGRISTISETQLLKASGVELSISGIPSANISLAFNENYQERLAKIWLGVLDGNKAFVGTPILIFTGRMDIMEIEDMGDTSNVKISVENRLIDLERPKLRRYTDEDQKQEFSGDRGLEFVTALNDGREIIWGS